MYSSTKRAPAQQTPAWRRQTLSEPAAADTGSASNRCPTGTVGQPSSSQQQRGSPGKRKLDAPPSAANSSQVAKRPRTDKTQTPTQATGADRNEQRQLKRQKSVTFADTPAIAAETGTSSNKTPKKPKGPAKKNKTPPTADLKPALEYLRLWKTARNSWKFNKNHQSALIKHVFDVDGIPAADIDAFYDYIQDLKGFVRQRLRETAMEIKTQDAAAGAAGFPEGTADVDATQERYETILSRFLESQQAGQKRKAFGEADYVASTEDSEVIIRRLVKRLRAELVLDELSDSDESGTTEMSTTSSIAASSTSNTNAVATNGDKRLKLNDGTGKRRRKLRTANIDSDTSSSESESESDSDTSSSGSSEEEESSDDEEETVAAPAGNTGYTDDTSSSSSSSSSESDSSDESGESDSD